MVGENAGQEGMLTGDKVSDVPALEETTGETDKSSQNIGNRKSDRKVAQTGGGQCTTWAERQRRRGVIEARREKRRRGTSTGMNKRMNE